MQSAQYLCDQCKGPIGDKPHFSLSHSTFSGIAMPPAKGRPRWQVIENLTGRFIHFCSLACLTGFFGGMMKRATSKGSKK